MTASNVVLRPLAKRGVREAIDYYHGEGGEKLARRFVTGWHAAVGHLARFPESGSPRLGSELRIPGLRSWLVGGFPHLVLYLVVDQRVDVLRVLHQSRDMPEWLAGGPG